GREMIKVTADVDAREVKAFVEMLKGLRIANSGHSFSVWIDPSDRAHRILRESHQIAPIDYAASKHFIDGDGSFYLGDITMAGVKVASVHFCKECGKKHAPRCDKCGSTRDLRSYHGPCGSCAFGKKATMEKVSTLSFLDELDKISFDVGGYLRNAGSRVSKWALNHAEGIGDNVGNAAVAFATPRES